MYPWFVSRSQAQPMDVSFYNKNYSLVYPTDANSIGCPGPTPADNRTNSGTFVVMDATRTSCSLAQALRQVKSGGATGLLYLMNPTNYGAQLTWWEQVPPGSAPVVIPALSFGYGFVALKLTPALKSRTVPISFELDLPYPNAYDQMVNDPSGRFMLQYAFGLFFCWALLLMCAIKLGVFVHLAGGLQPSFVQIELAVCMAGGFFCLFSVMTTNSWGWGAPSNADHLVLDFFEFWPISWAITAMILFGLYLGEVSKLTSNPSGAFKVFLIPSIVIISILWLGIIADGAVRVVKPDGVQQIGLRELVVTVYSIGAALAVGIIIFGAILLAHATFSSGISSDRKNMLLRIFIVSSILCCLILVSVIVTSMKKGWGSIVLSDRPHSVLAFLAS